jgi:hypothetical protein
MPKTTSHPSERQQELAALASLVDSARKSAEAIGSEKVVQSLNMALAALLDEIEEPALPQAGNTAENCCIQN